MDDCPSGLTQNIMTDSYTFQHSRRLTDALRTALLFVVVLLFALPASGQTRVFQFTGEATGEVTGPGAFSFANKIVRIQFTGPTIYNGVDAGEFKYDLFGVGVSGIIIVDGITYPISTTSMSLRSTDGVDGTDYSCYIDVACTLVDFEDAGNLPQFGIAIHNSAGGGGGSTYYHYFEGNGAPLTSPAEVDFTTTIVERALNQVESNRGGYLAGPGLYGSGPAGPGYARIGGGAVNFDFVGGLGSISYSTFTSGAGQDFGDAPDTGAGTGTGNYNTEAADGGPSHFLGGPFMGTGATDGEVGGVLAYAASTGNLDDNTGTNDEDGVTFVPIVSSVGLTNKASVIVKVAAPLSGRVDGWFDFNRNGIFESSENVIDTGLLAPGNHVLTFDIPPNGLVGAPGVSSVGVSYARFRISTAGQSFPVGLRPDGEVEDYQITILDGSSQTNLTGSNTLDYSGLTALDLTQPIEIIRTPGGKTQVTDGPGGAIILFEAPQSSVGDLTVFGSPGDDIFIVDYVNGNPANGPITIDAKGQAGGGDVLTIENNPVGVIDTVHHTYDSANDGSVRFYLKVAPVTDVLNRINYFDLEPITDTMVVPFRIFSFSAAVDNITSTYVSPFPGPSVISTSPATSETTTYTNPTTVLGVTPTMTINGGGGCDTFNVQPSDTYPITVNGDSPALALYPCGDAFTVNTGLPLPGTATLTLTETGLDSGFYTFGGTGSAFQPLTYSTMEDVALRFSDPHAFPLATYNGDLMYPLHTETGISIEPYFNWDIDKWPVAGPSMFSPVPGALLLEVALNSDMTNVVWSTTKKEDAVTELYLALGPEDHYISDIDRLQDAALPLLNNTTYYWRLTATLASGVLFSQTNRFKTVPALLPVHSYPKDALTIPALTFDFNWNVGSPVQPAVYWRMDLDMNTKAAFNGAVPSTGLGGDANNDNDILPSQGFAANPTFDATNLPSPLLWGSTYTWRTSTMWPAPPTGWVPQEVFDKNETDRMVSVSALYQFQTQTKAFVPTPSYPTGGLSVPNNTPELNWWVGGPFGALTFDLIIDDTPVPALPYVCEVAAPATGITGIVGTQFDTSTCSTPLVPGTTYYWQVRSNDGNTQSAYSPITSFTVNGQGVAAASTPSYPIGNLQIYTTNPQFHWFTKKDNTNITFVAWYKKRVGPAAASCAAVQVGGTSVASGVSGQTYVDVTGLEPGATYDWCVVSTGLNGSFDSPVAVFNLAGGLAKNFPVASWPKPNPTIYSLTQILHWYLEGSYFDVVSYDVEWCKGVPTGSTPVFGAGGPSCTTVAGITVQQLEITGLSYGDVVKWRVRANYTSGSPSDWNAAVAQGGFTVTGLLTGLAANLTYPAGNLIIYDSEATFSWWVSGGVNVANMFKIQYSYAETFPIIGNVTIETTSAVPFLNVTGLIPGHTYWWRVAVSNDNGATYGTWSSVASFAVHPGASAVQPRIGSPANSMTIGSSEPTLSWVLPAESESVLTYELRYASSEADLESNATVVDGLTTPFAQLNALTAGDYFWQVRSRTATGDVSPFSPVGTFSTTASFSVGTEDEIYGELPSEFELGQNYPNPFNPSTTIEFRMSEASNVSVKVYNVLGQVVKTLVNGTLPSGTHHVTWDARDEAGAPVSSGLYLYRMETTGFTATKTLVLMK